MYYGKVEICGVNTAKLPTLTNEEKKELLILTKDGDEAARERLIDGNLRLVLSIIQRFVGRGGYGKGETLDDLFQIGVIGLIKAIDNFNVALDLQFSTYAVPMIIGEIRRFLRDNNSIRVSRSVRDLAYRALTAREAISHTKSCEPTLDEIVERINSEDGERHTKEEVAAALEAIVEPVSLFDPVYGDSGGADTMYLMDQISDNSGGDDAWLEEIALNQAMDSLPDREKKIVSLRFFKGRTQMEIAEEIGISQAQVSRLEKGALGRIKKMIT